MSKGIKIILITITLQVFFVTAIFAQCGSGDGNTVPDFDPDDPSTWGCPAPLDTWVIVLVALALFFGYRHLQKQKRSLSAA